MLDHHVGGRDVCEVLAMSVTEAEEFFGDGETSTPAAHAVLDRLADAGKSVIIIEHHQAVVAHADWIIDLGPGAATTEAGSSSRAYPPTSSPTAPSSPASTSRPT